jgi:hypothetical protein
MGHLANFMAVATGRVLPPTALAGGTFRDKAVVIEGGYEKSEDT